MSHSLEDRRRANHFVYAGRQGRKRTMELVKRRRKADAEKLKAESRELKAVEDMKLKDWSREMDEHERELRDQAAFLDAAERICEQEVLAVADGMEQQTMAAPAAGGET